MQLDELGWTEKLEQQFAALAGDGLVPARVCRVDRKRFRVISAEGEFAAVVGSRTQDETAPERYPTVGDWCAVRPPESGDPGLIDMVMPRKTIFTRKAVGRATGEQAIAANVDVAFLITGLDDDYSLRRIERLLALAWESGARPVVVLNKVEWAEPLAEALLAGGLDVIEVTLRTEAAMDGMELIREKFPQMHVGAGTVLDAEIVPQLKAMGVEFAVSPGLNPRVVEAAQKAGMRIFPGVANPTDIEAARAMGLKTLKFFPAEPLGGVRMLKALIGPYGHTGIRFVPTGMDAAQGAHRGGKT